ncbi:hypothetical protein CYMTET_7679 [Cymbomonas tetramitiformis]|uniref:Glycosyl hydrolase family 30 TIM-barrel domain-containing protein n=1 Tax=Cymbomonas tetramitiformis TaxID=36881 RepID=A0AAE0GUP3_9CHLO|nr:hypothetical protein CYMTET_7679 [Cymbomonas tetramitiformis]
MRFTLGPVLAGVVTWMSLSRGFAHEMLVDVGGADCSANGTFASESIFSITWFNEVCNCGFSRDDIADVVAQSSNTKKRFNRRLQQTSTPPLTSPVQDYDDHEDLSNTVLMEKVKGVHPYYNDLNEDSSPSEYGEYSVGEFTVPENSESHYEDARTSETDPIAQWKQYFPEEVMFVMKRHKDKAPELFDYLYPDYKGDANPSPPGDDKKEDSGNMFGDGVTIAQEQVGTNAQRSAIAQKAAEEAYPEIVPESVKTDEMIVNTTTSGTCSKPTYEKKTLPFGAQWYYTSFDADYKLHKQSMKVHMQSGLSQNDYAKLVIDEGNVKQTMTGFGATLTESSAYVLMDVKVASCKKYWELLNDLFSCDAKGSQSACLRTLRVPLSSTEFIVNASEGYYSHDDTVCDFHLKYVNLANDEDYIIPVLKDILSINPDLKLFGVPFSAPRWMKKPNWWKRGELFFSDANFKTYSHLLAKVLKLYQTQHQISFSYLSLQNEPLLFELAEGPAMRMWPDMQGKLLELMPRALETEGVNPAPKVLVFEHNWNSTAYADHAMWSSKAAADAAAGVAYHCYEGGPESMMSTHAKFPLKEIHLTQCRGFDASYSSMQWNSEFVYIGAVMNMAQTVMHWPLALNPWGGPRKDGCVGCKGLLNIYVNRSSHPAQVYYNKNQEFYGLAMTSKFLEAGAKRLYTQMKGDSGVTMKTAGGSGCIWGTAYSNPSGTTTVYIHQNCMTGQFVSIQLTQMNNHMDLDELAPGIHTFVLPHLGSLVGSIRDASAPSVFDGPYENCKVFADVDGDLKHDDKEPHSMTDSEGSHKMHQQGMLSQLVVQPSAGCKDTFTGQKLKTMMRAPAGSKHVSPFTTALSTVMEHVQRNQSENLAKHLAKRKDGKLSKFEVDYKDLEHNDPADDAKDLLHFSLNISHDVDLLGDLLQQMRSKQDSPKDAHKLVDAYSKMVQIHAQNAIVDKLYLKDSKVAEPKLQTAFHLALAKLMPLVANFSDPVFLAKLDAELHTQLKDSPHYRFEGKSQQDADEIKTVWKAINKELMSWFDAVKVLVAKGPMTKETMKEAVSHLTKLSCTLNSDHFLDTIIDEMHLGGTKVAEYIAALEHYMEAKCQPRPELEVYWSKTTTTSSNEHNGAMVSVISVACFVAVMLVAASVYKMMRVGVAQPEIRVSEKVPLVKEIKGAYDSTVDVAEYEPKL